jgi:pyruvate,water dikinase
MYAYHTPFSEDRRTADEKRFWFQDALHYAEPFHPFDAVTFLDYGTTAFNQASSRLFVVPSSLGAEYRFLNGYTYLSPNSVTDEQTLGRRATLFMTRGGFYFEHWDELYSRWRQKVEAEIRTLQELEVPALPEFEDEAVVTAARGLGTSHELLRAYDRLLAGMDRVQQYHMEFQLLAHGAYLAFYEQCREAFPGIPDQAIAAMVSGFDTMVLRPDEELRRLAHRAVELGLGGQLSVAANEKLLREALAGTKAGDSWLADLDQTKDPWFYFSYGNGIYCHHRSWIDDTTLPIASIRTYVERLEAGESIDRPREALVAERERITSEYRSLLSADARAAFDEGLALARTVFPHVEDHNFYIDHWYHALFWNKVREFGALLAEYRFLDDLEDVFFLRPDEVRAALEELRFHWSAGTVGIARGPVYWPPIVERRTRIYAGLREWTPPPALGQVPDAITDPVFVTLWGITRERLDEWLCRNDDQSGGRITGFGGSPGVAEGVARVVVDVASLEELEDGEILVAPWTSPSWTPVFAKIAAAVLDVGGMMSHAAIVAREYGLPAVVGTGTGTKQIRSGDRIRVDGSAGVVELISPA